MLKYITAALLLIPLPAMADGHNGNFTDNLSFYAMPFGGLEKRLESDTRGYLDTTFGRISGNAVTQFETVGWTGGFEIGTKFMVGNSISVRVGPYASYSQSGLAEIRPINAMAGGGGAVFLPTIPIEGDVSTFRGGLNIRPAWENESIVTPHLLLNFHGSQATLDIKRVGGVTIDDKDSANWEYGVGGGLGMTIDLTNNMAIMVEGAYYRSLEDARWSINTPAGIATIDSPDQSWTVTTGLVISF